MESTTLVGLIEDFGSEDKCRAYLEELRWPDGLVCPRCEGTSISRIAARNQYECNAKDCRYQFSVTAGTLLNDSHLPLWKWFLAVDLSERARRASAPSNSTGCSAAPTRRAGISATVCARRWARTNSRC